MLTDTELDEIEARANAATEGPWMTRKHLGESDYVRQVTWVECGENDHSDCAITQTAHATVSALMPHGDMRHMHNAAFIAAARTDVPRLVAEIRRLRAASPADVRDDVGEGAE